MPVTRATRAARIARPAALGGIALAAALGLTGCLDSGFPGPTTTPAGSPTPSASASPSATTPTTPAPTPSETVDAPTPVSLDCAVLLPIDALYDIDPNLGVVPVSAPSTRLAQDALAADGTVCQVTHATSGAAAFISVSAPGAAAIDAAISAAGPGSPLGDTGLEAHGGAAQLVVVSGEHLVGGECDRAFNPDSLRAILALAIAGGA